MAALKQIQWHIGGQILIAMLDAKRLAEATPADVKDLFFRINYEHQPLTFFGLPAFAKLKEDMPAWEEFLTVARRYEAYYRPDIREFADQAGLLGLKLSKKRCK